MLGFFNEESTFYFLEKLFHNISYPEISTKEFLKEEETQILKILTSSKTIVFDEVEKMQKVLNCLLPIFYSGLFFHQELDFQSSFYLFEKLIDRPSVFFLLCY